MGKPYLGNTLETSMSELERSTSLVDLSTTGCEQRNQLQSTSSTTQARHYNVTQREVQRCGSFVDIFGEQIKPFAQHRYQKSTRGMLINDVTMFFSMLAALAIRDINAVTPTHARYFLLVAQRERDHLHNRAHRLWVVFEHLVNAGVYRCPNPFDLNYDGNTSDSDESISEFAAVDNYSWLSPTSVPIQMVGERLCDFNGCTKCVPPGAYPAKQKKLFCSASCRSLYYSSDNVGRVRCAFPGCSETTWFKRGRDGGRCYCPRHSQKDEQDKRDREACGPFYTLFKEYFQNHANGHYEQPIFARSEIRSFLTLLNAEGLKEINEAGPKQIEMFLDERRATKDAPRADYVKTMFDYLIEKGIYGRDNPVLSRIYYERRAQRKARPYSAETMSIIWRILEGHGNTQAATAIALGEDCGPRAINICRCHVHDVSLDEHRIWICSKNKNQRGGWVYFGPTAEFWLRKWLDERPKNCGHDFLLTNSNGLPMCTRSLEHLLKSILLKEYDGHVNEGGLDEFNFHRLRHTNSTNLHAAGVDTATNEKIHLWDKASSREGYTKINDDQMFAACNRTMPRVSGLRPRQSRMTMAEFIAQRQAGNLGRKAHENPAQ